MIACISKLRRLIVPVFLDSIRNRFVGWGIAQQSPHGTFCRSGFRGRWCVIGFWCSVANSVFWVFVGVSRGTGVDAGVAVIIVGFSGCEVSGIRRTGCVGCWFVILVTKFHIVL